MRSPQASKRALEVIRLAARTDGCERRCGREPLCGIAPPPAPLGVPARAPGGTEGVADLRLKNVGNEPVELGGAVPRPRSREEMKEQEEARELTAA
jgi:hypothetical protein